MLVYIVTTDSQYGSSDITSRAEGDRYYSSSEIGVFMKIEDAEEYANIVKHRTSLNTCIFEQEFSDLEKIMIQLVEMKKHNSELTLENQKLKNKLIELKARPDGEFYHEAKKNFESLMLNN